MARFCAMFLPERSGVGLNELLDRGLKMWQLISAAWPKLFNGYGVALKLVIPSGTKLTVHKDRQLVRRITHVFVRIAEQALESSTADSLRFKDINVGKTLPTRQKSNAMN